MRALLRLTALIAVTIALPVGAAGLLNWYWSQTGETLAFSNGVLFSASAGLIFFLAGRKER